MEEADYKKGADIVKRLLAAEVAVIGAVANDDPASNDRADDGQQQESTGSTPNVAGTNPPVNQNTESLGEANTAPTVDARRKKTICKFYKSRTCKYGTLGERCPFNHPKKCLKYITHGNKNSRGCKKGKECSLYHPPLCWSSINYGTCDKGDCKFQHIRGTVVQRFYRNENVQADEGAHHTNAVRPQHFSPRDRNERTYAHAANPSQNYRIPPPERDSDNVSRQNFLELRDQIQQMQGMMRKMMMVEKDQRGIGTVTECHRCHEPRH